MWKVTLWWEEGVVKTNVVSACYKEREMVKQRENKFMWYMNDPYLYYGTCKRATSAHSRQWFWIFVAYIIAEQCLARYVMALFWPQRVSCVWQCNLSNELILNNCLFINFTEMPKGALYLEVYSINDTKTYLYYFFCVHRFIYASFIIYDITFIAQASLLTFLSQTAGCKMNFINKTTFFSWSVTEQRLQGIV